MSLRSAQSRGGLQLAGRGLAGSRGQRGHRPLPRPVRGRGARGHPLAGGSLSLAEDEINVPIALSAFRDKMSISLCLNTLIHAFQTSNTLVFPNIRESIYTQIISPLQFRFNKIVYAPDAACASPYESILTNSACLFIEGL